MREFMTGVPIDTVRRFAHSDRFLQRLMHFKGRLAAVNLAAQRPFFADGSEIVSGFDKKGLPAKVAVVDTAEAFSSHTGINSANLEDFAPLYAAHIGADLAAATLRFGARGPDLAKSFWHTFDRAFRQEFSRVQSALWDEEKRKV